jgi:hypothetical protein
MDLPVDCQGASPKGVQEGRRPGSRRYRALIVARKQEGIFRRFDDKNIVLFYLIGRIVFIQNGWFCQHESMTAGGELTVFADTCG